jgi:hypothetical protein
MCVVDDENGFLVVHLVGCVGEKKGYEIFLSNLFLYNKDTFFTLFLA